MGGNFMLLLFFFILYGLIITYLLLWGYCEFRERLELKDDEIEKLKFQLANKRKK